MKRDTKKEILIAFDKSDRKTIADVARLAGITPSTFYFHYYKDAAFRRSVIEKQKQHLEEKAIVS